MPRQKNRPITVTVRISGARQTLKAFRDLPKDATKELREASGQIALWVAASAAARGAASDAQSAAVAATVRVARDRVPAVQAGGSARVTSRSVPVWQLLFGAEFGARSYRQFRQHRGRLGYWFFSAVEAEEGRIERAWLAAVDDILKRWADAPAGADQVEAQG